MIKEPDWRRSKCHRSFIDDSYKVGLAEHVVKRIVQHLADAFKRVFFPNHLFPDMDVHKVSEAFVSLLALIH
jgi:hypothetical protein